MWIPNRLSTTKPAYCSREEHLGETRIQGVSASETEVHLTQPLRAGFGQVLKVWACSRVFTHWGRLRASEGSPENAEDRGESDYSI